MELPLVNVSTCELRSLIRFFTAKKENVVNIHRNLVSVYGEGCMSIQMVRRWRSWFLEGRKNVHDDEQSGRPVTATDNAAVAVVRYVVEADRRVTIDEIRFRLPPGIEIGRSSIGTIMSDVLNFRKVCARWVPRLLSENHKQQRMEAARAFLEMHRRDGDQLFSRIVTGDESWVHHSTPETKRQSMVWKKPEKSAPKKAKVTISAGKVMAIVFWDCKDVLLVEYLPPNTTVNASRYCEVLTKLSKRPGLLSRKVLLLHDNARPHAARTTQTLLENIKWEIFTHPPYSPDLAPGDFHLFPALKLHLEGKHFAKTFVFNMSSSKPSGSKTERKIADEHRNFQEKWELEYFCSEVKDKIICLICNNAISVPKLYNIKRHYEQHKSKYDTYEGLMRQEKLKEFKLGMKKQQFMFTKVSQESEAAVRASYVLSEMIAKHSKPFTEGDFIKECLIKAAEIVCPG
ncbi:hypothetical protein LAZ67_15002046, partial [Cordylochernes scorpioides]